MGTRGIVKIKCDGKTYAYYNHFDSYPSGLGEDIYDFIKNRLLGDDDYFAQSLRGLKLIDEEYTPTREEIEAHKQYGQQSVSTGQLTEPYCLLRNLQGVGYLKAIADGEVSLFLRCDGNCGEEYVYTIDIDNRRLRQHQTYGDAKDVVLTFGDIEYFKSLEDATMNIEAGMSAPWSEVNIPRTKPGVRVESKTIHTNYTLSNDFDVDVKVIETLGNAREQLTRYFSTMVDNCRRLHSDIYADINQTAARINEMTNEISNIKMLIKNDYVENKHILRGKIKELELSIRYAGAGQRAKKYAISSIMQDCSLYQKNLKEIENA